jgi:hypothetical protein
MSIAFGFLTLRNASGFDSRFLFLGVVRALDTTDCFALTFGVAFCLARDLTLTLGSAILLDIEEMRANLDTRGFKDFAGTVWGHLILALSHTNSKSC